MEEKLENLGLVIDRLDNTASALNLGLAAQMHVDILRKTIPEIVKELKESYIEIAGNNPWE